MLDTFLKKLYEHMTESLFSTSPVLSLILAAIFLMVAFIIYLYFPYQNINKSSGLVFNKKFKETWEDYKTLKSDLGKAHPWTLFAKYSAISGCRKLTDNQLKIMMYVDKSRLTINDQQEAIYLSNLISISKENKPEYKSPWVRNNTKLSFFIAHTVTIGTMIITAASGGWLIYLEGTKQISTSKLIASLTVIYLLYLIILYFFTSIIPLFKFIRARRFIARCCEKGHL